MLMVIETANEEADWKEHKKIKLAMFKKYRTVRLKYV